MASGYSIELTPASAARLRGMMAMSPIFASYFQRAMAACVVRVRDEAQQLAPVGNDTYAGSLRRDIKIGTVTPYEGHVDAGTEIPYARRREYGFSGMTDALGRYYADDPGQFYMRGGLENSQDFIAATFGVAANFAIRDLGLLGGGGI